MSHPTITSDRTTRTRVIKISGGGRLPAGYPPGEYEVQVERVTVTSEDNGALPFVWAEGPRVLKSGELGKWRGVWVAAPGEVAGRQDVQCPDWLADLAGLATEAGA